MDLYRMLADLFAGRPSAPGRSVLPLTVRCLRCGEIITAEVNLANDLSADYGEDGGGPTTYFCRKLLLGQARCFQQIEVSLRFNAERRLIDRQITGGKFVDPAA